MSAAVKRLRALAAVPWIVGATSSPATAGEPAWFTDEAATAGLEFAYVNGMAGEFYYHEMMGGGVALLDYDGDGDQDVYLVQGGPIGEAAAAPPPDRLFRNDLEPAPGGGLRPRFVDVTDRLGVRAEGYGMGVATGDIDNDGRVDLYLTNFGANQLLRNLGDGRFADVTAGSGAEELRWTAAAVFLDFDRDGWQDLYLANYVRFSPADNLLCSDPSGRRDYCGPLAFQPEPDRLLRNRGDGSFEDVTTRAGMGGEYGAALGVIAADLNRDGWPDLYVTNDMTANQLWLNRGDGSFRDEAWLAGTAVNGDGQPEASMGVTAGDFDADGDEDLFLTHLDNQTNTLYRNDGRAQFDDWTEAAGLGAPSWRFTGFGTAWIDYDNDGWLDLITVNGAVKTLEALTRAGDPFPLHQTNQLFRNQGGQRFEEVTARAGPVFELSEVSRGLAAGDLDNDGDTDVVVANNSGPVRLLLNRTGQERPWLGLNADLPGTTATVTRADLPALVRAARTGGSYASASDPRLAIGLGSTADVERLEVRWPGSGAWRWHQPPSQVYLNIRRRAPGGGP